MTIAQDIYQEVQAMPVEQAKEVLHFAQFLRQKSDGFVNLMKAKRHSPIDDEFPSTKQQPMVNKAEAFDKEAFIKSLADMPVINDLSKFTPRTDLINGDSDDLIHMNWEKELNLDLPE